MFAVVEVPELAKLCLPVVFENLRKIQLGQ
jgi:hypothetical protein